MAYDDAYYKKAWQTQQNSMNSKKTYNPNNYPLYNPNDEDASSLNSSWQNYIFGDYGPAGGGSSSSSSSNNYGGASYGRNDPVMSSYMKMIQDRRNEAERQRRTGTAQLDKLENDNLRQAYIQNEQSKQAMPQQIAMTGGGGVSETTALGQQAAYGQNRTGIQNAKMEQLTSLNNSIDSGLNADISGLESAYASRIAQLQEQDAARRQQEEQMAWEREQWTNQNNQWNKQFEYGKQQDALTRQTATRKASSGGGSSAKSGLTLAQAQSAWNNGTQTPYIASILDSGYQTGGTYANSLKGSNAGSDSLSPKARSVYNEIINNPNLPVRTDELGLKRRDAMITQLLGKRQSELTEDEINSLIAMLESVPQ